MPRSGPFHRPRISPWSGAERDPSDEFDIGTEISATRGTGLCIGDEKPKWPTLLFRKGLHAETIQHHPGFDHRCQRHTGAEAAVSRLYREVCRLRIRLHSM